MANSSREIVRLLAATPRFRRAVCRWGLRRRPDIVYAEARKVLRRRGLNLPKSVFERVVLLAERDVAGEETCVLYPLALGGRV